MIAKVTSGGQTGADQAALRAARAAGIPTGGYAPKGWLTEDGPAPWLADFGLTEMPTADYPARTRANIDEADGTLILIDGTATKASGGTALTHRICMDRAVTRNKPFCVADVSHEGGLPNAVAFVRDHLPDAGTLNVAGPRESKSPGIGARVKAFMGEVFKLLAEERR
jgi:hypothetical protein